jgi:hypothetical protein
MTMRLAISVNTAEAEDGYDENELPTFSDHVEAIEELLRMGHYNVDYVDEAHDGE